MYVQEEAAESAESFIARSIEGMDDPLLSSVLDYWHGQRGTRAMPRRREIDPVLLPRPSLPHLLLLHIESGGFRYDLAGTAIERHFGMSVAGRRLGELPFEADISTVFTQPQATVETQRPTYREDEFVDTKGRQVQWRRLLLPLSDDGTAVTDLFGIWLFQLRPPSLNKAAIGFSLGRARSRSDL